MYKVYVKTDPRGMVISINSDAHLTDTTGWVMIDEGEGDRFHHAQSNYLSTMMMTEEGVPRFKLDNGLLKERTLDEITADIDSIPEPPLSKDEQFEMKFNSLRPLIGELMVGKSADIVIPLIGFMPDWGEGKWTAGASCLFEGYPYKVNEGQSHDSTGNPSWNPKNTPALFSPWHGVSKETALPYRASTGAHDIYKVGEYMVWTDGVIKKCLMDTPFSPEEYAQAWEDA